MLGNKAAHSSMTLCSHLSHPTTPSHLFRTNLIWIWTTIRAAPRGSHLIVETNQQCLHLRVSRRVPTQQLLKASDDAIPFHVGLNYSYSRWGQKSVDFHRPKAKLHTARTLRMFARTRDCDTPLRPFFGLIRKPPFHRQWIICWHGKKIWEPSD